MLGNFVKFGGINFNENAYGANGFNKIIHCYFKS